MSVIAKWISANGLMNPFTNKKKWQITCGDCGHTWNEKVPIMEPSSAVCPCCGEQNMWSVNKFAEEYDKKIRSK